MRRAEREISALQRQVKQTAAELEGRVRLHEVGMRCLQAGSDFQGSLDAILAAAISLTEAQRGNITLIDSRSGALTIAAQHGFEDRFLDSFSSFANQHAACKAAIETRARVFIDDLPNSKIFAGTSALQALLHAGVRALQCTPLISSPGKVLGIISTHYAAPHQPSERELRLMDLLAHQAADYLEHRQAEEALSASSAQMRRFIEAAPTGLVRCSRELRYLSVNSAYAEFVGRTEDEIIGRRIVDVIGSEGWERIRPYIERALRGQSGEYETVLPVAGTGTRHIHVRYTPERDGQENIGWLASVTDITEFKRVERQLQQAEKMAAAGQLAASLAHEINNPLSAVMNVLYLLQHRPDLDPEASSLLEVASNEVERLSRIVKQSLSYYRAGMVAKEVNLAALVEESLQVFADKFQRAGVIVNKTIKPGIGVMGFANEIRQVVDNLLVNAVEATPSGGRLTVCLRRSRNWKNPSQSGARLTIADNGCGIPKTHLPRVFDSFFTTKSEKGTGLGLWVVKGIVEKHGGTIKIRSNDSAGRCGTTISTFWPFAAPD